MTLSEELHQLTRVYLYDLAGFAEKIIPWGRGNYQGWTGLWPWHRALFESISREAYAKRFGRDPDAGGIVPRTEPILRAISSGTGTGKSTLVLPSILFWTLSCFPFLRGVAVSASRENLSDKFFADCRALMAASPILNRYFDSTADGTIWVRGHKHTRAFIFRTSGSVEALSGQHSFSGCTCVLFEEAGGISDASFLATDGARSDAQAIAVAVGQPTTPRENYTWFRRVTFGDLAELWNAQPVSLLDMPNATPALRKLKAQEHGGEDSDQFCIFVLGLPERSGTNSFISRAAVDKAMDASWVDEHGRPMVPADTPVVAGLDLARAFGEGEGGSDNCMAFRAGADGRIKVVTMPGRKLEPRDRADWAIQEATRERPPYGRPVVCLYDETGLDGLFRHALEEKGAGDLFRGVNFGRRSPSPRWQNYRAAMWGEFSRWLFAAGMLPKDEALARLIVAARSEFDANGRISITPKKVMGEVAGRSRLDELDARLLTMHVPEVQPKAVLRQLHQPVRKRPFSLMGS